MNVTHIDLLVIAIFLSLNEYLFTRFFGHGITLGYVFGYIGIYSFMSILVDIIKGD